MRANESNCSAGSAAPLLPRPPAGSPQCHRRANQMDLQPRCHFSKRELMPSLPFGGRSNKYREMCDVAALWVLQRISRQAVVYEQPINTVHTACHKKPHFPHFSFTVVFHLQPKSPERLSGGFGREWSLSRVR